MENMTHSIAAQTQRRPAASLSEPIRSHQLLLVADDKRALDRMIQDEQHQGWVLVSRSYSLDEGHGATLIRKDFGRAA